jgi:N-acetylneuraminic acid mutarotase
MPMAVNWAMTGVLNGQIYLVGGYNGTAAIADTQIYNPATNVWSAGVSLPTTLNGGAAAVVSNVLYVIGGSPNGSLTQTNTVWAFSLTTNEWAAKSNMPTARQNAAAVVENNVIYVIGGYANGAFLNTVQSYDPATDTWTDWAPMLVGESEPSVGLIGTKIIAAGGFTGVGNASGQNEFYNAFSNTWASLHPDPTPRGNACAGAIGRWLYVAGGNGDSTKGPALTLTESFYPAQNSWKTLTSMPHATRLAGSVVYNGLLYCIGGADSYNRTPVNYVQIYQP